MKPSSYGSTIALVLAAAAAGAASAQPPPDGYRIGFVNTERVMREAREAQQAQKGLEAEFLKRNREIAAAEERLRAMVADLEKNAAGPSAADRQKREREAVELRRDTERRKRVLSEDLNLRRDEAQKQVVDKANAMIRRVAEEEKLDAVFVEAAFVDPRIDITAKVIKALDAAR